MANPNLELLIAAARLLKPILDELVFVGGCATGLLVTDEAVTGIRPTTDVDAIAEVTSYAAYTTLGDRLHELGFSEDTSEGAPLCRWIHQNIRLDLMPLGEEILGFSNRWYESAINSASAIEIEPNLTIQLVSAPYFFATKLEAFKGRGRGDFLSSHDLEDLITVIDGRPELLEELRAAPNEVRSYIANSVAQLLQSVRFVDAIPGYLLPDAANQERIGHVLATLKLISELGV